MTVLLGIMLALPSAYGLIVYGQFGKGSRNTYAVKERVSWKHAAELCKIRLNGEGGLMSLLNPNTLKHLLFHHRHILQQNGWPLSNHLWTGIVFGYGSWKRSFGRGYCDQLPMIYKETLPDIPNEHVQCLILNMTGTSLNDTWDLKPCTDLYDYLCRESSSLDAETRFFNETTIDFDMMTDVPDTRSTANLTMESCQTSLISKGWAYAAIYSEATSTCTLVLTTTLRFPVQLNLIPNVSLATFVTTTGHNVTIVESQNIKVNGSSFEDCLNETSEAVTLWTTSATDILDITLDQVTKTLSYDENCTTICQKKCKINNYPLSRGNSVLTNIKLDKKLLSSYKRRLSSASDDRMSSFLIGISGTVILMLAVLTIVVPDVVNFVRQWKILCDFTN